MPDDPAELAQVRDAIAAGRVKFAPECLAAISRMNMANPDYSVTTAKLGCWGKAVAHGREYRAGLTVDWETASAGSGHFEILVNDDGSLYCEDQDMGREFVKAALGWLVDRMTFASDDDA